MSRLSGLHSILNCCIRGRKGVGVLQYKAVNKADGWKGLPVISVTSYKVARELAAKGPSCRSIEPSHDIQAFCDLEYTGSGQFSNGPHAELAHPGREDRQPSSVSATGNRTDCHPGHDPTPERLPEQVAPAGFSGPAAEVQQLQPGMQGMSLGPGATASHGALPRGSPTGSLQDSAPQVCKYRHFDMSL